MKRTLILAISVLALGGPGGAIATAFAPAAAQSAPAQAVGERAMTFAIGNMTCALCPITVRKAIEGVAGVTSVSIDFDAKTALVVFDPTATTPEDIAAASTNAGYPASVSG